MQKAPRRIEQHDALVCELIGLQGCLYEDVLEAKANGVPLEVLNAGLTHMYNLYTRVLDETDVMENLLFGAESAARLTALRCGTAYNMAVSHIEADSMDEGRSYVRLIHSQMSRFTDEEIERDELCSSIVQHNRALAFTSKTPL